jgi:L-rhamnose mutarotase
MARICFQLQVHPDRLEDYRRIHSPVSPDMLREIAASGRRNYSLFLRPDGQLIGYYETDDVAASDKYLAESAVAAAWESAMAPYFRALNGRADQDADILTEIFNLDDQLLAIPAARARQDNS